jgi:hypothetical protein
MLQNVRDFYFIVPILLRHGEERSHLYISNSDVEDFVVEPNHQLFILSRHHPLKKIRSMICIV